MKIRNRLGKLTALCAIALACPGACAQKKEEGSDSRKAETRPVAAREAHAFDDALTGGVPKGFSVAETKGAGTPASWRIDAVKDDAKRGNAVRVDSKNHEGVYNLLLTDKTYGPDFDVVVDLKSISGEDDQGGGLCWRAKDADNYYVTRWNPLEKNIRVYKVEAGKRTQLQSRDVEADPAAWHRLLVAQHGPKITVSFDGKEVLAVEDATFKEAGRIGFWTKADACTWFDGLVVEALKK